MKHSIYLHLIWRLTVCCSDVVMIEGFLVLVKCFIDSWKKNKMKCKYVCRVFNVRILRLLSSIEQVINSANTTKHIPSQPFYSLIMDGRPSNEAPSTCPSCIYHSVANQNVFDLFVNMNAGRPQSIFLNSI